MNFLFTQGKHIVPHPSFSVSFFFGQMHKHGCCLKFGIKIIHLFSCERVRINVHHFHISIFIIKFKALMECRTDYAISVYPRASQQHVVGNIDIKYMEKSFRIQISYFHF